MLRGCRALLARKRSASEARLPPRFDVRSRAELLDVRLTEAEAALLQKHCIEYLRPGPRTRRSGLTREEFYLSRRRFLKFARRRQDEEYERHAILSTIEEPSQASALSKHLLLWIGRVGTVSWSVAGTMAAGEAGMHIIGCSLVGCVSALGGGTVNNLLFGDTKRGVGWVRNPHSTLMLAVTASVVTFVLWPIACQELAERRLQRFYDAAAEQSWYSWVSRKLGLIDREAVTKEAFLTACRDEHLFQDLCKLLKKRLGHVGQPTASDLFEAVDANGDGVLDLQELENLVKWQYDSSSLRYVLDTVSVSASAVTGTAAAVSRGLHPVVCIASSVTSCFGGILRDLICHREVALGSQSFAACTATGAAVYMGLRELCLRGHAVPLGLRIVLTASTTVAMRLLTYFNGGSIFKPMYGGSALSGC